MIGAMPAVAVRHERRRAEKRGGGGRRPSQLQLQLGRAPDADATPSPDQHRLRNELYVCGKVAALHAVVGSLLLGIVVLVVGLVQLSPGAEAAAHRYYLMGAGAALMGTGILGAVLRCICLHWYNRKFREEEEEQEHSQAHKNGVSVVESGHHHHDKHHGHDKGHDKSHDKSHDKTGEEEQEHAQAHKNGVSVVESGNHHHDRDHGHDHKGHDKGHDKTGDHKEKASTEHKHEKPKLKAQASVGKDVDLVKQPTAVDT